MWLFSSIRKRRLQKRAEAKQTLVRVPVKKSNYKWTPGENKNPQILSFLKAGHAITYDKRYLITGDTEKENIVLVDIDNMIEEFTFNGINHLSMSRVFSKIKEIKECTQK